MRRSDRESPFGPAGSAPRVLLAEADATTRVGLRVALAADGFDVVAEAVDAEAAVEYALERQPQIALLAVALPGGGIAAARRISARLPATRLVLLSDEPTGEELLAAILAGASGYLGRDVSQHRLPAALRGVLAGETALPRAHTEHLLEVLRGREAQRALVAARGGAALTRREWEVLELVAAGEPTAAMAHRLGISEVTVRRHISSVLAKLGLPDRASAAAFMRARPLT